MTDHLDKISENVNQLTQPRKHAEPYTYRTEAGTWIHDRHHTDVPSLLQQLRNAVPGRVGDATSRSFSSRTPGRDDALDILALIDTEAWRWCQYAGMKARGTDGNVRALVGIATTLDDDNLTDLAWNTSSWVALARVTVGWDRPARSPDNTCPLCGKKGGLRIRLGDGVTSQNASAACLNCHEHWDETNVLLLAQHIRWENGDMEETG